MSTAGKVLTVLIMLVMVAWLVMMSAVSQLNANYGQKIKSQETDLENVTKSAAETTAEYLNVTEKARLQQDLTERDLRLKLTDISTAERRRSNKTEELTRLIYQLQGTVKDAENAKTNLATRDAEKVKIEENLAKTRDEIAKLQAINAESKAQLAQLQDDFKKLLADNAAKVKAPVAKPASTIREAPAS